MNEIYKNVGRAIGIVVGISTGGIIGGVLDNLYIRDLFKRIEKNIDDKQDLKDFKEFKKVYFKEFTPVAIKNTLTAGWYQVFVSKETFQKRFKISEELVDWVYKYC